MSVSRAELRTLLGKTLRALDGVPVSILEDELMFALDEIRNEEEDGTYPGAEALAEGIRYGRRAFETVDRRGGMMIRVITADFALTHEIAGPNDDLVKAVSRAVSEALESVRAGNEE